MNTGKKGRVPQRATPACTSDDSRENLIHSVGSLLLHVFGAVGVGVQGDLDVSVAHEGGNRLHGDVSFDQHGGAGVTEIMEADLLERVLLVP